MEYSGFPEAQVLCISIDALVLQGLLAEHMGMHLDNMQRFADASPADRSSAFLPNAHLPKRGFYRIK